MRPPQKSRRLRRYDQRNKTSKDDLRSSTTTATPPPPTSSSKPKLRPRKPPPSHSSREQRPTPTTSAATESSTSRNGLTTNASTVTDQSTTAADRHHQKRRGDPDGRASVSSDRSKELHVRQTPSAVSGNSNSDQEERGGGGGGDSDDRIRLQERVRRRARHQQERGGYKPSRRRGSWQHKNNNSPSRNQHQQNESRDEEDDDYGDDHNYGDSQTRTLDSSDTQESTIITDDLQSKSHNTKSFRDRMHQRVRQQQERGHYRPPRRRIGASQSHSNGRSSQEEEHDEDDENDQFLDESSVTRNSTTIDPPTSLDDEEDFVTTTVPSAPSFYGGDRGDTGSEEEYHNSDHRRSCKDRRSRSNSREKSRCEDADQRRYYSKNNRRDSRSDDEESDDRHNRRNGKRKKSRERCNRDEDLDQGPTYDSEDDDICARRRRRNNNRDKIERARKMSISPPPGYSDLSLYGTRTLNDNEEESAGSSIRLSSSGTGIGLSSCGTGISLDGVTEDSLSRPSQVLARLEDAIGSYDDHNTENDDHCILSLEADSTGEETNLKQSHSYIINEPRGSVIDHLVEGSKINQQPTQISQSFSGPGKGTTDGGSQRSQSSKKDGLACNFSVEPMSPMSEMSSSHNRPSEAPPQGIMAMLEQYLPEDVSDGPLNAVLDQYMPTFTSSAEASSTIDHDLLSTDRGSSSSTSHPLRFVNELALANSAETGKRSSTCPSKEEAGAPLQKGSNCSSVNQCPSRQSPGTCIGSSGRRFDHQDSDATGIPSKQSPRTADGSSGRRFDHQDSDTTGIPSIQSPRTGVGSPGRRLDHQDSDTTGIPSIERSPRKVLNRADSPSKEINQQESDFIPSLRISPRSALNQGRDPRPLNHQETISTDLSEGQLQKEEDCYSIKKGSSIHSHPDGKEQKLKNANSLDDGSTQQLGLQESFYSLRNSGTGIFSNDDLPREEEGFEVTEQGTFEVEPSNSQENLTNTSIQYSSPKWRGWMPEQLEVILLDSPRNAQTFETAKTETTSPTSFERDLETRQLTLAKQHQTKAAITPKSFGGRSDTGSAFSIPPITATLSYDSEDIIPRPPDNKVLDEDSNIESECTFDYPSLRKPLSVNVHAKMFNFNSPPSSQKRTPKSTTRRPGNKLKLNSIVRPAPLTPRTVPQSRFGDHLLIRSTRSEDLPWQHQTKSYLDIVVQQIDGPLPEDPCDIENKENRLYSSWQSSLNSFKRLNGTQCSQRMLLTRLIAERNGANAIASTVKSKLTDCSSKFRNALAYKDHEIEGLRRANQTLRVQVAEVRVTRIEPDAPYGSHEKMTQLTRKLQNLNVHGAIVERAKLEKEGNIKTASRLYRSEQTSSSELLEIDKCVFELKTTEVTTLQVSDRQDTSAAREQNNTAGSNTDNEVQVAISKIVAKEMAFFRKKVESLEQQLEEERANALVAHSQLNRKNAVKSDTLGRKANQVNQNLVAEIRPSEQQAENPDREDANARRDENEAYCKPPESKREGAATSRDDAEVYHDSKLGQLDELSKRLDETQREAKRATLENEMLKWELQKSRSACQEYQDKLSRAEHEIVASRKASRRASEHFEESLNYYKQKAQALEATASKSGEKNGDIASTQLDASKKEIASLRELVDTLQRDYKEAEQGRVESVSLCEALDMELKRTKRDLQSRILDNDDLLQKTEQLFAAKSECDDRILQLENNQLSQQNKDCHSNFNRDEFLEHYKRSVVKLEQEISTLREDAKHSSSSTNTEITSLRELVEKLRHDNEEAKHDRDEATEKCRDITIKQERLKNELQDSKLVNQELENKADRMKEAKEAGERKIALLESERAQLKLETEKQSLQSHGSLEVFKVRVLNLEKELSGLKDREIQNSEKAEKQVAMLRDETLQLQEALRVLKTERDSSISSLREAKSELSEVMQNLENTNREKHKLVGEVQHHNVMKEDYEGRLATLKGELNSTREEKEKYLESVERWSLKVATLERAVEEMKKHEASSADKARQVILSHECQISRLQSELESATTAVEQSRQGISSKEERILTLQKNLEREKQESRQTIASKEEHISDLQKDLQRAKRDVTFKEERISSLRKDLEREAEDSRKASATKEERISDLRQQLFKAESQRDTVTIHCDSISVDLERAKRDLESRILDNTELSLRVEQLFAAKEECEEKIAALEAGSDQVATSAAARCPNDNEEALFLARMRISTLESEVEELREAARSKKEVEVDAVDAISSCSCSLPADVYSLNREKQEALARCSFMARENEKIAAMLESTRADLSQSIIEISRLEMDLDEASLAAEGIHCSKEANNNDVLQSSNSRIRFLSEQNDILSRKLELALAETNSMQSKVERLQSCQVAQERQVGQELQAKFNLERQDVLRKMSFLEQRSKENEKTISQLTQEKQGLVKRIETLVKVDLEQARIGRQDLVKKVTLLEDQVKEKAERASLLVRDIVRDKQELLEQVKDLEKVAHDRTKLIQDKQDLLDKVASLENVTLDRERLEIQSKAKEERISQLEQEKRSLLERLSNLERVVEKASSEKQDQRDKMSLFEKQSQENKKRISDLEQDKQDLLQKVGSLEKSGLEQAKEMMSSVSEKRALLDEIRRLEQLQLASESEMSIQQTSLKAAMDEVSQLKGVLIRKEAQERNQPLYSDGDIARMRSRISDLESQLHAAQCSSATTEDLLERVKTKLKDVEAKASSAEKEAAHFKLQNSEMEQKLCTAEDAFDDAMKKFKSEQNQREKLSKKVENVESELNLKHREMEALQARHKASSKAQKLEADARELKKKNTESKNIKSLTAALTISQENEAELIRAMQSAQQRDRGELLSLREQVSTLQNHILAAEEENKKIANENQRLLSKQEQASQELHQKDLEIDRLLESLEAQQRGIPESPMPKNKQTANTSHDSRYVPAGWRSESYEHTHVLRDCVPKDGETMTQGESIHKTDLPCSPVNEKQVLSCRMADTLSTLESSRSRLDELEDNLQKSLSDQDKYVETIDQLRQEVLAIRTTARVDESKAAKLAKVTKFEDTLNVLQQNKSRINELEGYLQKSLMNQERDVAQIDILKQELKSLQGLSTEGGEGVKSANGTNKITQLAENHWQEHDLKSRQGSREEAADNIKNTAATGRITQLSKNLEKVVSEKDKYMQEIHELRRELVVLKSKEKTETSMIPTKTHNSSVDQKTSVIMPPAQIVISESQSEAESDCGLNAISDMSVTSKTAMSISSSVATQDIVQKHTLYAQKLNKQLGLALEREDEVSRTVSRKVSLLEKQIARLMTNDSQDDISALSGSSGLITDAETMEFDLECRLADVTQLASILDLVVADKKKSEHRMKALYQTNHDYMKEVKSIIGEKDTALKRQGSVIETLTEELALLKEREKVESRTLISEISLLEENLSHLMVQYNQDGTIHKQAENRLEIALRERQSLGVGLKQIRSEMEHCQRRMPKLNRDISTLQQEMEARIAKLKNSEGCPTHVDQHLCGSANQLKQAVEDVLSYTCKPHRKQLRLQTIRSSSSDTGEPEYFVTLNDYDYQVFQEGAAIKNREQKRMLKAAAASKQRFVC